MQKLGTHCREAAAGKVCSLEASSGSSHSVWAKANELPGGAGLTVSTQGWGWGVAGSTLKALGLTHLPPG